MKKKLVKTIGLTVAFAIAVMLFPARTFAAEAAAPAESEITEAVMTQAQQDAYAFNFIEEMANEGPYQARNYWSGGGMCYGFAKMVLSNLFGVDGFSWSYDGGEASNMFLAAQLTIGNYTYENLCAMFAQARPGDVLQVTAGNGGRQHSMVFYRYYPSDDPSETHIRIYDANGDGAMTIQFVDLYLNNPAHPNPYISVGTPRGAISLLRINPAESISISDAVLTLDVEEIAQLSASVTPSFYTRLVWSSDNSEVAVVDENGRVTAKTPGVAVISVASRDGSVVAKCRVFVASDVTLL